MNRQNFNNFKKIQDITPTVYRTQLFVRLQSQLKNVVSHKAKKTTKTQSILLKAQWNQSLISNALYGTKTVKGWFQQKTYHISMSFLRTMNKNSFTQLRQKPNFLRGLRRWPLGHLCPYGHGYFIPFVSKRDSSYYTDKDKVVSITYEEIGLFPRSFSRVLDRFLKQLFSDVDNLVIQEYRFYRYLFLTTIKTIFILFFVPFLVNFAAKNYVVKPITEYFWNTSHPEIFLNSYEQKRAFAELEKFEEKIYFETLVEAHSQPFPGAKAGTQFGFIALDQQRNFLPVEDPALLFMDSNVAQRALPVSKNALMSASLTTIKNKELYSTKLDFGSTNSPDGHDSKCLLSNKDSKCWLMLADAQASTSINKDALSFDRASYTATLLKNFHAGIDGDDISIQNLNFDRASARCSILWIEDPSHFVGSMPFGHGASARYSILWIEDPSHFVGYMPSGHGDAPLMNKHLLNVEKMTDFRTFYNNAEIDINYYFGDSNGKDIKNINLNSRVILPEGRFLSEKDFQKLTYVNTQIPIEYKSNIIRKNKDISKIYQEKTIELATYYNNHSIEAITNFFADLLSLFTLLYLLITLEIQINITKSFLLEVFFGLDDSKKSLLILLITDLLVGYHSSNLWELFFEFIFNHYGIPESQTGIFLLVATLPVLLDVLFKYLIFRHLNRSSPATVATYQAIIE
jgi:hypothetical protein